MRKPHPSFWIGGGGEKVTLKLVAQYADACNVGYGKPDEVRHKLAVLREHCDRIGRDYDEIIKSTELPFELGRPAHETVAQIEKLIDAGIDYFVVYIPPVAYDHEPLHKFAENVISEFA